MKQKTNWPKKCCLKLTKRLDILITIKNGDKKNQSNGQIQINLFKWLFGQVRQGDKKTKGGGGGIFWLIFKITMTMISCRIF
jgi:hypothetical protein